MKRTKKQNKIMVRTKRANKRSKFVWCSKFRHFQHVEVCKVKCKDSEYCDAFLKYKEGV